MTDENHDVGSTATAIQEVINVLLREGDHNEWIRNRLSNARVEEAVNAVQGNVGWADEILGNLFPSEIPPDASFYDKLAHVEYRLGHHNAIHQLNGLLWARAFRQFNSERGRRLLDSLTEKGSRSFFAVLSALPTFLERCSLPPDFLAHWIVAIRTRLGNDGASGGFWDGMQSLANATPESSLEVARILTVNPPDENTTTIVANLLGHLRATVPDLQGLSDFLAQLRDHPHVDRRVVYHRSWITTGLRRVLADEEILDSISRMSAGTKEEVDEAFNVLRILLPLPSTSDESFLFGIQWLHERTTGTVSDFWKHFLIQLAHHLHDRWNTIGKPKGIPSLLDLVVAAPPIAENHDGTWLELEALLVFLWQNDPSSFRTLLFGFACKDQAFSKRFQSHDKFHELRNAITKQGGTAIVVEALLSSAASIRHLGFAMFDGLGITDIADERLNAASDDQIAVLIFSFQLEPFYDEVIPRFLLALEPRVRNGSKGLQDLFVEELVFRSKDLPGACLEAFKKKTSESNLLHQAVQEAEKYFAALKPCFRSAINSMGIPGLERAMRMRATRQDREMRAQMNKASIFSQLCTTSYTAYGGTNWQTFMGGKLGEVSQMQQISHSAELPRMFGIDPEGIAIRRFNATRMIRGLLADQKSGDEGDS